jgi:hypothetical protein
MLHNVEFVSLRKEERNKERWKGKRGTEKEIKKR